VRIELRILHVRKAAAHVHGEQFQTGLQGFRFRRLVFRNDDHGRLADAGARILIRRAFDAAGDHQPDMHVIAHAVGFQRLCDGLFHFAAAHADVQGDGLGAFIKTVEMGIQKRWLAGKDPESLPNAIAQHEATVEYRNCGLSAWFEDAIDPNPDIGVAHIIVKVVNAGAHRAATSMNRLYFKSDPNLL